MHIHVIKARNNALFVNNSPSHGAYTCTCTELRGVLFEYLKLLCSSNVSVMLSGMLSNVHTICFHFFFKFLYSQKYNQLFVHRLAILSKKKQTKKQKQNKKTKKQKTKKKKKNKKKKNKKNHIKSFKDSRFTLFPFQVMFSLCNLWLVAMQIKPYTLFH